MSLPTTATRAQVKAHLDALVKKRAAPSYCVCGCPKSAHPWLFPPTGKSACKRCSCPGLRIRDEAQGEREGGAC